jgi:beta-glucanase (GH16 family)
MKNIQFYYLLSLFTLGILTIGCKSIDKKDNLIIVVPAVWKIDFIDNFNTFNAANWQDQRIWVNNETHCYVPDGKFGTREVSDGSLKLRVVNIGKKRACDNLDKYGKQRPATQYVAGRITSKNKQEFIKGKWTARLKLASNGEPSMFPAWWILGAQNNESPVQEVDENICWPLTGSGEIDIFEHHGDQQKDHFTAGAIKSLEECDKGDWWSLRKGFDVTLNEYHEYAVEWEGSDLVYTIDNKEIYRNIGQGDEYPEKMFAILNFAKITDAPMKGKWEMEVDWVKHEFRE